MISERPQGSLPSNTEPNLKKNVKAITLMSGKVLTESEKKLPQEADRKEDEVVKPEISEKPVLREYKPPIPYPAKLNKDRMMHNLVNFLNFLNNCILTYFLLKLFCRCLHMLHGRTTRPCPCRDLF